MCTHVCSEARYWRQASLSIALYLTFLDRISHFFFFWSVLDDQAKVLTLAQYVWLALQPLTSQFYSWSNRGRKLEWDQPPVCPLRWCRVLLDQEATFLFPQSYSPPPWADTWEWGQSRRLRMTRAEHVDGKSPHSVRSSSILWRTAKLNISAR